MKFYRCKTIIIFLFPLHFMRVKIILEIILDSASSSLVLFEYVLTVLLAAFHSIDEPS